MTDVNTRKLLSNVKRQIADRNLEKFKEVSKNRLKELAIKKMKTCFIGSIAKFEEFFSFLWHTDEGELTEEQKYMLELWEKCRTEVLNNGNNQLRALLKEIDNQTIEWNRYKITLPVKVNLNKDGNDEKE